VKKLARWFFVFMGTTAALMTASDLSVEMAVAFGWTAFGLGLAALAFFIAFGSGFLMILNGDNE
jgi:hypothetical protein